MEASRISPEDERIIKAVIDSVIEKAGDVNPGQLSSVISSVMVNLFKEKEIQTGKEEIVEAGKLLYNKGFVEGTSGNISIRLPDQTILITPSGMNKGQMVVGDVIRVDLKGNLVDPSPRRPSSETKMHLRAYQKRDDVMAIVHAHPPFSTGFASAGLALDMPVLPEAVLVLGEVPLVEYGTPSTREVPDKLELYAADHDVFLLENHGALTFGENLDQAVHRMETLELFARVVLVARLLGGEKLLSPENLSKLLKVHRKNGKKDEFVQ